MFFSLTANFQHSVSKLGNSMNDLQNFRNAVYVRGNDLKEREKSLKKLDVKTAKIAYHPSTSLSKCWSVWSVSDLLPFLLFLSCPLLWRLQLYYLLLGGLVV